MASVQLNLVFLACTVVLLHASVLPWEVETCKHFHTNEYYTVYSSTYYTRYYPIHYGCCKYGDATCRETKRDLYSIVTYYYGKRDLSGREVWKDRS